jgi:hypothetical protein
MWTDHVYVATGLSRVMHSQYLSWNRLHTLNGAVVSGTYSPERLECTVTCPRAMRVHLTIPAYITGEPVEVRIGGTPRGAGEIAGGRAVVTLPGGTHRLVVDRDLAFVSQVTVVEPMRYGAQIVNGLERAGFAVRWLRSLDLLSEVAEKKVSVCFVPHIVPMDRGILSTIYVHLTKEISQSAMEDLFSDFYEDAPFVILRKDSLPATKDVWGTNFCHLALRSFGRRAVIISAIDNLIKGASGQAVENMNLMAGLKQTEGLL